MKFYADFHLHSPYSRATSKDLTPENLDLWAAIKGIKVLGTGDFTHPKWFIELKEKLEYTDKGLLKLKKNYKITNSIISDFETNFLLTSEISNIYKKKDKIRKIHSLIFAPDFDIVEKIQKKLLKYNFNISSDGRPILGLDVKNLLELLLEISENIFFVPAHIWTPWFSILGDKSGFDNIEECFEDLTKYIYALETGLSSDPPMNWLCSFLDKYTLISNSDAHSLENIGRNANLFDTQLDYNSIINALKNTDNNEFNGTVDMYPQEGKYHFDGHRLCNVKYDPAESIKNNEICPICGKKLTIGVMNRVVKLSDRKTPLERKNRKSFYYIIPLKEILSEINNINSNSIKIKNIYNLLIKEYGSELNILLDIDLEKLNDNDLKIALKRMREGNVYIQEGYDGVYGKILVFNNNKLNNNQNLLFEIEDNNDTDPIEKTKKKQQLININLSDFRKNNKINNNEQEKKIVNNNLNQEQINALLYNGKIQLIIAGPGTGKTKLLINKINYLIKEKNINQNNILGITFTNKACDELKERLKILLHDTNLPLITTFHSFGYDIIKENLEYLNLKENIYIIDNYEKEQILLSLNIDRKNIKYVSDGISKIKNNLKTIYDLVDPKAKEIFINYEYFLQKNNLLDMDDLIYKAVKLLENSIILQKYLNKYKWILVDEYQDINYSQYYLLKLLTENNNLIVIGDPNQSIYQFRGSDLNFIKNFKFYFPEAEIFYLTKSYRCSNNILKASATIINNTNSLDGFNSNIKIKIVNENSDIEEALYIAKSIEKMVGGLGFNSMDNLVSDGNEIKGIKSFSDFAILCRIKEQFKVIQKALDEHNIPYQIIGEDPITNNLTIKKILNILSYFIYNKQILNEKEIDKQKIINDIKLISLFNNKSNLIEIIDYLTQNYIKINYNDKFIDRFIEIVKEFDNNYYDFFKFIKLGYEIDFYNSKKECVSLITMHASKGLEFETVFIPGCEHGLIPYNLFEENKTDFEDEKRLLYVAMTRAKNNLILLYSNERILYNKKYNLIKSNFIEKIHSELIEFTKINKKNKKIQDQKYLF